MLANGNHSICQLNCGVDVLHEGAGTALDVQQNAVGTGSDLLAHDARCNQRHRINRCGNVAKRIKLLVSWNKIARLTCDGNANLGDLLEEIWLGNLNGKSRNCLKFIQRTARMAQAAATHLGNLYAKRCNKWANNQRGFIANTAGRVFINLDTRDCREVHHVARLCHCHGQVSCLVRGHTLVEDGHRKRGSLIIGNIPSYIARDKVVNLGVGKLAAIALLFNHVVHAHS